MTAHVILCVLLALALGAPTVNAATTFNADLRPVGGPSVPGSGTVLLVADSEEITWQVNVTDVVDLTELQIVDGMGDGSVVGVTLKTLDPSVSGDSQLSGTFDASALNPAVGGDLDELAGHICMGHIYAAAKLEGGQMLTGKLAYEPEEGSTLTCEEAVPGDHSSHMGGDHMGGDHMGGMTDADGTTTTSSSSAIALSASSRSVVATVVMAVVFLVSLS